MIDVRESDGSKPPDSFLDKQGGGAPPSNNNATPPSMSNNSANNNNARGARPNNRDRDRCGQKDNKRTDGNNRNNDNRDNKKPFTSDV